MFRVQDAEPSYVKGNGTEAGQVISTTIGGKNGLPKQVIGLPCWLFIEFT